MEISPEICYAVLIKRKYIFIKIVFFYIVYWRYLYGTVVYLSDNKFYHSSIYHHPRAQTLVQKPKAISGQIWKLTGYMLLPATLIISLLSLFRTTVTQIILTSCVLLMQIIILIFLSISAKKLSEKK